MKKWNLIVNVGQCQNCYNCVISARDEHTGNDFPGYAAPAAATGDASIRILRRVQGSAPMVETVYLPVMCNHCDNAPCIGAGKGAVRKRRDGIVIVDPLKARGRKDIVKSCPYGAIVWNEEQRLPQTWIFDAHLLDQGWSHPRCQQACPTGVFEAVKLEDAAMRKMAESQGLKVLNSRFGTRPRVWYRGLERWETCFIGGSVARTIEGRIDCVAGAKVHLLRQGVQLEVAVTDDFGDFCFGGLPKDSGAYQVEVLHEQAAVRRECSLGESLYLGELMLTGNQVETELAV